MSGNAVSARYPAPVGTRWTPLPEELASHAIALGLDATQIGVIWRLEARRWVRGALPWPSLQTIAAELGASERTIRRALGALRKRGLIEVRERRGKTSLYDLEPLWHAVADLECGGSTPDNMSGVNTPAKTSGGTECPEYPGQNGRPPRSDSPDTPDRLSDEVDVDLSLEVSKQAPTTPPSHASSLSLATPREAPGKPELAAEVGGADLDDSSSDDNDSTDRGDVEVQAVEDSEEAQWLRFERWRKLPGDNRGGVAAAAWQRFQEIERDTGPVEFDDDEEAAA